MKKPFFSIIIPVYNVRNFISLTLDSILSQSYKDFEILAIDDGSIDGSGGILSQYESQDERIKVIRQSNSGVSGARNIGLEKASGSWILFVDGDDSLCQDALSILSECIQKNPTVDLIGYGFQKIYSSPPAEEAENQIQNVINPKVYDCSKRVSFQALNHYMVWSECFKKDILGDLRFQSIKNGEDVLFCNGIAMRSNAYASVEANIYLYLQRKNSARSNQWDEKRLADYIAVNQGILKNLINSPKSVDHIWLKRWIGLLLQYVPQAWNLDKSLQKKIFNKHKHILEGILTLPYLPKYLRFWIKTSIIVGSKDFYRIIAMWPMRLYSMIRK